MSGEREIKTGQISVSKANFLKPKTWSSRCCTLYEKTDRSPAKLQITDESNPGAELKILSLENVCIIQKKVYKSKKLQVEIHWRKEKFSFAVDSEQEAKSWIDHLNDASEFESKTNKKISVENLSTSSENDADIFVNNLDYQSFDMWTYDVEMHDTEASLRCQLSGPYRLQLTKQGFFLLTVKERRVLYQWPYHFIRRYGKSQSTFTIQAGRKCDSGEGSFCFGTKPGESLEIFQRVNQLTLQLKASQNEHAAETSPVPQGIAKANRPPGINKVLPSSPTETTIHNPLTGSNLRATKSLPFQMELQHKLSSHADKYSNVNISALPSPEIQPIKFPPVVKAQHFYSNMGTVTDKMSNLSTNTNLDSDNYSLVEVNNNHRSRNLPNRQHRESDYDQLDFNIIDTPFQERQKNFKPYIYDTVLIKNDEENLYEEATPFTEERNACGGKLPPVPVVITQKPFMEPATVDDGYR